MSTAMPGGATQPRKQVERVLRRVDADQRGGRVRGQRVQLQRCRRDDPQCALCADEQRLDVVAGVVFAQALERRENPPIREHHFESQYQIAHHAVAQNRGPAGIGRQIAADLGGALRTQAQGEEAICLARRGLCAGQCAADFDDHGIIGSIDVPDAIHALQGHDDLGAALIRGGAAAVAGIAAMGNHGDCVAIADLQDAGGFIDALGP
jgi:hypothetical protein